MRFRIVMALLTLLLSANLAEADGDHFDQNLETAEQVIQNAIDQSNVYIPIRKTECIDLDSVNKKPVCNYRVSDAGILLIRGSAEGHFVDDVTLICNLSSTEATAKCLITYVILMTVFTPGVDEQKRKDIVDMFTRGFKIGDSTQIIIDDNRYSAQKVVGTIWMHIEYGRG